MILIQLIRKSGIAVPTGMLGLFVLHLSAAPVARAQATNAEILQEMAVRCIVPVAEPYARLLLRPDATNPFLNHAVFNALAEDNRVLYLDIAGQPADSIATGRDVDASLGFSIAQVSIRYDRKGRRNVTRHIDLDLEYLIVGPDSRFRSSQTCSSSHEDEIRRSRLDDVENKSLPITQGVRPQAGWIRRYAEPVVIGAASAVAVYLFFNIRSDSNDSP